MTDLPVYEFPARAQAGVLFGLSVARLAVLAAAGVVLIVTMTAPTAGSLAVGATTIALLTTTATVPIAGRVAVDWLPLVAVYGWQRATGNSTFLASPDVSLDLPAEVVDLPGELFGIELHQFDLPTTTAAATDLHGLGVVVDTFRRRQIAVAEVSAAEFLFLEPDDQQARIAGWGRVLDHVAQSMPEITRLQLVHLTGCATAAGARRHHHEHGGRGTSEAAASYADAIEQCARGAQQHRLLLAIALDPHVVRREVRQAGGRLHGAARVLMDRATTIEDALRSAGLQVHGWLTAGAIGHVLRTAHDPGVRDRAGHGHEDGAETGHVDPAAAGPTGMVDGWSAVRHDSGWSTTLQVVRPPTRPVAGDFLQNLMIGVPGDRRMSLLYVPTPAATAERRAQTEQVSSESEQALRARWGFGLSARQQRLHHDAAQREQDLVDGRAVFKVVWLLTVTAPTPAELDAAVVQAETAARRCSLELRRLAGSQRSGHGFTLPLCRGAR